MENFKVTSFLMKLRNNSVLTDANYRELFTKSESSFDYDIVKHIIENKHMSSTSVRDHISLHTKLSHMENEEIDKIKDDSFLDNIINKELIKKHNILPVKIKNELIILTHNPISNFISKQFKLTMNDKGLDYKIIVCDYFKLSSKINELMDTKIAFNTISQEEIDQIAIEEDDVLTNEVMSADDIKNDAPMNRMFQTVLLEAINIDASDIHIEPFEKNFRIRFRVDGVLRVHSTHPKTIESKLTSVFKIKAGCDISEKRIPQDGRIKLKWSHDKSIDFRVNFLPTLFGEKIVIRKLDASSAQMGIDHLGYDEDQKELYLEALKKPQGMILVTGPTGSGKTVSLYTGLNIINTDEINISTAEDPVEINLFGINQVPMNPKQGLTFAEALRAFLRQDPDVIMVGEIRDLETAEIAIKAAQTGHMVMSTLHTNSASETLTRLLNMGVPAFNVATVINLIIAQRLGRRLCKSCKVKIDVPNNVLLEQGFTKEQVEKGITIYEHNPDGCEHCNNGFKGRVGIYEVMKITKNLSSAIMNNKNAIEIREIQEAEGFRTLRQSALIKVIQGVTSLTEINRITQD